MTRLNINHIDIFLSALDYSYASAWKFDNRPGLKFLIQKVANLDQPANLYRQTCAAWTIKILTLLDICLNEINKTNVNMKFVKLIIKKNYIYNEKYNNNYDKLIKYIKQLKITFDIICDNYIDVVINKNGKHSIADSFAERKIFLLVAQPDDFPEITSKELINDSLFNSINVDKTISCNKIINKKNSIDNNVTTKIEEEYRSLKLFDLASDYFMESGPESESETDDSRPISREKRIIYQSSDNLTNKEINLSDFESDDSEILKNNDKLFKKNIICTNNTHTQVESHNSKITIKKLLKNKHRKSEQSLLTRKNSLKFFLNNNFEYSNIKRSKSLVEFYNNSDLVLPLRMTLNNNNSSEKLKRKRLLTVCQNVDEKNLICQSIIPTIDVVDDDDNDDDNDELLKDYERSKKGFRINPFTQNFNGETDDSVGRQVIEIQKDNKIISRDSDAQRKAWAEILNAVLDWTLVLPVIS